MIRTRPTPTGYQHHCDVRLRQLPPLRFTDPLEALADLENGLTQPLVEVIEESPREHAGVVVRVSVFSETPVPSPEGAAAINGLAAELRYSDNT